MTGCPPGGSLSREDSRGQRSNAPTIRTPLRFRLCPFPAAFLTKIRINLPAALGRLRTLVAEETGTGSQPPLNVSKRPIPACRTMTANGRYGSLKGRSTPWLTSAAKRRPVQPFVSWRRR
jgi:hypothetical protein